MTKTVYTNDEQIETPDSDSSMVIGGMRFFSKLYDPKVIRSAMDYVARPNDIFIVTIPKSGTTWMQVIVYALLTNGRAFDDNIDDYIARNPFLEMHGQSAIDTMPRPGAIKTHLLFDCLPHHTDAKYIVVIRNPKDVCVSFHRFITSMREEALVDIPFDLLFNHFLDGQAGHVDYFDNLLSCWSRRNDPNVLLILYEEMQLDIRSVINRVATFLGVVLNEQLLERIVKISSFDYLHKAGFNEKVDPSRTVANFKFLRKGIMGDWRTVLSKEQSYLLDARFKEKTRHVQELHTLWDDYGIFDQEYSKKSSNMMIRKQNSF